MFIIFMVSHFWFWENPCCNWACKPTFLLVVVAWRLGWVLPFQRWGIRFENGRLSRVGLYLQLLELSAILEKKNGRNLIANLHNLFPFRCFGIWITETAVRLRSKLHSIADQMQWPSSSAAVLCWCLFEVWVWGNFYVSLH